MQRAHWGVISITTPVKEEGQQDWAEKEIEL